MTHDELAAQLSELLARTTEGRICVQQEDYGANLRDLGLDSLGLLNLLVAIEDSFGHEWDPDTPPHVLASLQSIAAFMHGDETGAA